MQIGAPPYLDRSIKKPASGFGDWPFLLIKQRLASANEQNGNYIVDLYLAAQAPTGVDAFTNDAYIITPSIAGGLGFGDFDVQATLGVGIPTDHKSTLGTTLLTNVTLQYHFLQYFWPEVEMNHTYWADGLRGGKNQVLLTTGIVLGRFVIQDRVGASIGFGYQFAVAPDKTLKPVLTPLYDHAWIVSGRLTF